MTREAAFIDALRALAHHRAARGLKDDAAVLEIGSETLILTHDMMVEGVHYLPSQDMADVAWKLVAVNLSDLAAKGAKPIGALLGHMLDDGHGDDDARFLSGLEEALTAYNLPLLGGDTVSGDGPRSHGLTAIGQAIHRPAPSRAGAKPDHAIYITGPLGAAMIGFEALRDEQECSPRDSLAFRRPTPLLGEGAALAPHASAMMDISDGLLLDAQRMAMASAVTFSIDTEAIPIACPQSRRADALRWGEDYQLLLTAPADCALPIALHRIGTVLAKGAAPLLIDGKKPAKNEPLGYTHG